MSDDRSADADDAADGRGEPPARQRQPASAAARRERMAAQRSQGGPDSRDEVQRSTRSGVRDTSGSLIQRIVRFLREVVAELRKVIWPTRKQVVTYTAVVLVFVSFMVAFVAGLDVGLAKVVLYVFG